MTSLDSLFQCLIILTDEKSFPCIHTYRKSSVSGSHTVHLSKEPGSIFSATSCLGVGGLLLYRHSLVLVLDKVREIHLTAPSNCSRRGGTVRGESTFERWIGGS